MEPKIKLTHLSLFSGIGGLDLAAEMAGFTTVGQCEWADYPTKVLEKHWPNVPRWRDVRDVTGQAVAEKCGSQITVISGGFPCQPHSNAGKRLASGDERDLWGEFARVICEVRPGWVVAENVYGLLSSEHGRFFGRVLRDLASMGYDASWGCLRAFDAGLPHIRKRICIVAHAAGTGWDGLQVPEVTCRAENNIQWSPVVSELFDLSLGVFETEDDSLVFEDDGVSRELPELRAIGNAVAPPQFAPVFRAIAAIENAKENL